ncbi:MAG TPA: DMT family transporter [Vicinamibacterales bacterium]|nr:DMT family transporter [Vicinamibacterales bacterium]
MTCYAGRPFMPSRVAVVWVITCLIWSTVWLFIKIGVTEVPPVSFAAMRLIIAILVMVPVTLAGRTPLPRQPRDWGLIAGTGVILLGFNYALLNWGLQFISSGLTAVLQSMTPAFALVFGHYLLPDEPITGRKVAGLALGVFGVGVIFWDRLHFGGGRAFAGAITVTLGAVCVAFAYVLVRRGGRHLAPGIITTGQMIAAFVPLLIYGWTMEGNPFQIKWTSNALVSAAYLALAGSVLAAWLNYWLLSRVGTVNLLIMGLIEPPIAILLGAWILGESMNSRALSGGALILTSMWLVMAPVRRPAAP